MKIQEIPRDWAICPNEKCPRSGECLRHQAYRVTDGKTTEWYCVLPQALQGDGSCAHYKPVERVTIAWGFVGINEMLRSRDARHDVRLQLTDYFGSRGSYYRARDGVRALSPEEQQYIRDLVARYGYDKGVEFDRYEEKFDF